MAADPYQITVVIPAYNAAAHIARTLDSVLAQTHSPDEIIVVDDGSTDTTAQEILKYGNKVTYIHQKNAGASAARNTGIQKAQHPWIALLDGDDEWLPEKLALQVQHLKNHPNLVWTAGNYLHCQCSKNFTKMAINPERVSGALGNRECFDNYFSACLMSVWPNTDTLVIKRSVLEEAGLFKEGQLRHNDVDMWFRIAYRWPQIGFINQPLAIYHLDVPNSITKAHKDVELTLQFLERHEQLSVQAGEAQASDFKKVEEFMLRNLIRRSFFNSHVIYIRQVVNRFGDVLPLRYQRIVKILTIFPRSTGLFFRTLSRIVRFLRLRQKIQRHKH